MTLDKYNEVASKLAIAKSDPVAHRRAAAVAILEKELQVIKSKMSRKDLWYLSKHE
ncbi:hypothetical protein F401_gp22 [Aeromonas phage phiAS7]|uniref:Uncharacterized protein n=1 Tax=Aeromonas phage phiAS7 TaxID=1141132 RepID=H6UK29_9CAUD|nr:hypothetical protein F401_gp22 [Aeromonas phage phiAS7]AEZ65047.1 hypothetical protein phiAS7_00022 [Aeromonas phage phiAS7]